MELSELPRSGAEARAGGISRYFNGKPCPRGHVAARYAKGLDCVECNRILERDRKRKLRATDPERMREDKRRWYASSPGPVRASVKRYAERHPDAGRSNLAAYRARKRATEGRFTKDDVARVFRLQRGRCGLCRKKLHRRKFHVDHVVALAVGGSNWPSNIQLLCASCNLSKGARPQHIVARERGLLI